MTRGLEPADAARAAWAARLERRGLHEVASFDHQGCAVALGSKVRARTVRGRIAGTVTRLLATADGTVVEVELSEARGANLRTVSPEQLLGALPTRARRGRGATDSSA